MAKLTIQRILADLRTQVSPDQVAGMDRFLKEPVPALGLTAPQLRAYAAGLYRELHRWPSAQRNRLCTQLWQCGYHEGGLLVAYLYRRFARSCGSEEFLLFASWIARHATTWAHVDSVATWLLAASIANVPALAAELLPWTASPNWAVRRAAAVSLIYEAKHGRHLAAILEVARLLERDEHDLVRKGVGWLLKEAYVQHPREIVAFLTATNFPRLVLRYAAEKMTPRHRAAVLAK